MGAKVQYFGDDTARLLGTLHHPQRLRARSAAVLLCNPFGEEASRAHRTYRVLATQLERAGYAALRFDYSATGDSTGDDGDGTVDAWLRDIATASDELQARVGAKRLVVVGLRLGATLAALATRRGGLRPRHLILWDPIVDGAAYLRELDTSHRSYMRAELGDRWIEPRAGGVPTESLGAVISPQLAAQLGAIDLERDLTAIVAGAELVTVVSSGGGDPERLERVRRAVTATATARWIALPGSAAWNSDDALNASIVPMDIVSAVVARIEETIP